MCFLAGRHAEAVAASDDALTLMRQHSQRDPNGIYFRSLAISAVRIGSLYQLARYRQFASELTELLHQAQALDNRAFLLKACLECSRTAERRPQARASGLPDWTDWCGFSFCWEAMSRSW